MVPPLHYYASRMRSAFLSLVVGLALLLPAAPAAAQSGPRNCSVTSQNLYVRAVLDQYYLWYQDLPELNPANFANPEAYLEAVRYRPRDSSFSYITSRAANEAFYGDSQFVGMGISTQTGTNELRVLQVFADSPASEAGLARGDHITEINGRSVQDLVASGDISTAFGENEPGVTVSMVVRAREGEPRQVSITKRVTTIPTVSLTRTFRVDGRTVGYVFFRNFVQPSYAALDEAFAALKEAGATELVIDVRYNGGGLVDVATHLGGLVGGPVTDGRVFGEFRHNDRNTRLNETLRFGNPPQTLTLQRLGERAHHQRPAAAHPRHRHRRHDLRQACRPVRLLVLRQGARGRVVLDRQRRWAGRLFRRHRPDLHGGRRRRARSGDGRGIVISGGVPLHPHRSVFADDLDARVPHAEGPRGPGSRLRVALADQRVLTLMGQKTCRRSCHVAGARAACRGPCDVPVRRRHDFTSRVRTDVGVGARGTRVGALAHGRWHGHR
jgi:hypothetical protein